MNEHQQETPETQGAERPKSSRMPSSFSHLFKIFLFYLAILGVIAGWNLFQHYQNLSGGWLSIVTLLIAAALTYYHWHKGHHSRLDDIVEGNFPITEISLFVAFAFSIVGIGVTDYSPQQSYRYWAAMTVLLTIAALIIGSARAKELHRTIPNILVTQLVHWGATWVAVIGVFILLDAGRLNYESTGLALLIVLGLATFLDGYRVSWRLSVIGILMFVTSLVAGYLEQYIWVLLFVSTALGIAIYIWGKHHQQRRYNPPPTTEKEPLPETDDVSVPQVSKTREYLQRKEQELSDETKLKLEKNMAKIDDAWLSLKQNTETRGKRLWQRGKEAINQWFTKSIG